MNYCKTNECKKIARLFSRPLRGVLILKSLKFEVGSNIY